jgi:hypothetical protein
MSKIVKLLKKIGGFFASDKVQTAITTAATVAEAALPVVAVIAAMTPTKADDQILAAYRNYGIPVCETLLKTPPEKRGYALLDLATQVLQKQFPKLPVNVIMTAVQLAVTAVKAG